MGTQTSPRRVVTVTAGLVALAFSAAWLALDTPGAPDVAGAPSHPAPRDSGIIGPLALPGDTPPDSPVAQPEAADPSPLIRAHASRAHAPALDERGGTLEGRVIDAAGQPLAHLDVWLWFAPPRTPLPWGEPQRHVASDDTGAFRFEGLDDGGRERAFVLAAGGGGLASPCHVAAALSGRDVLDDVELVVVPALAVSGIVLDSAGVPQPGITVHADSDGATWRAAGTAWIDAAAVDVATSPDDGPPLSRAWYLPPCLLLTTDAEGRFEFPGLPDRWSLRARTPGGEGARLTLDLAADRRPIQLVLGSLLRLEGSVHQADGSPAWRASVQLIARDVRSRQRTGPDGRFALENLDAGPALLVVADDCCAPLVRVLELQAGPSHPLALALERGLRVAGRVQDADGRPRAGLTVHAWSQATLNLPWSGEPVELATLLTSPIATTDASGAFAFDDLPAGSHRVFVGPHPAGALAETLAQAGDLDLLLVVPAP
jgi:hypothetical protein